MDICCWGGERVERARFFDDRHIHLHSHVGDPDPLLLTEREIPIDLITTRREKTFGDLGLAGFRVAVAQRSDEELMDVLHRDQGRQQIDGFCGIDLRPVISYKG